MLQSSNGGLRLSDSSTMNDPEEGRATRYGREIKHLLQDQFAPDSWPRRRYDDAHVCCFVGVDRAADDDVEPGDDLLFWRLYGNDCRGLSITIPTHVSADLLHDRYVQQVTYTHKPPPTAYARKIALLIEELDQLRSHATDAKLWNSIYPIVLPHCDLLMAHRFLQKRAHYSMEREYRAVAFVTRDDEAPEDREFSARGHHVQYQRIRTYVQTSHLASDNILCTNSRITIGSNVPEKNNVQANVEKLVTETLGLAPNVVRLHISNKQYRPR